MSDDIDEIPADRQMLDDAERVVQETVQEAAHELVRQWKEQMALHVREEQRLQHDFEGRLRMKWAEPLDLFEVAQAVGRQLGQHYIRSHGEQVRQEDNQLFAVLTRLHARACLITSEVHSLLLSGHASGAMARWRSLHEVAVVMFFLREHGQEMVERYMLHEVVESAKAARWYERYHDQLGYEPLPYGERERLEARVVELCNRPGFGQAFRNTYGWAASAFPNNENPNIADLERAVHLEHMRPYYQMASYGIHLNPKGITFNLGNARNEPVMLAGPSDAGLADPGHATLSSLYQCTVALLTVYPTVEALAQLRALDQLSNEAGDAFLMTHDAIMRDARDWTVRRATLFSAQDASEQSALDEGE